MGGGGGVSVVLPPWSTLCDCPQNFARERPEFKHINRGSIRNQKRFR